MFNPSSVVIEAFVDELVEHYVNMYGKNESDIQLIISNARNALEIIANSDAPYHDVNLHRRRRPLITPNPRGPKMGRQPLRQCVYDRA